MSGKFRTMEAFGFQILSQLMSTLWVIEHSAGITRGRRRLLFSPFAAWTSRCLKILTTKFVISLNIHL